MELRLMDSAFRVRTAVSSIFKAKEYGVTESKKNVAMQHSGLYSTFSGLHFLALAVKDNFGHLRMLIS